MIHNINIANNEFKIAQGCINALNIKMESAELVQNVSKLISLILYKTVDFQFHNAFMSIFQNQNKYINANLLNISLAMQEILLHNNGIEVVYYLASHKNDEHINYIQNILPKNIFIQYIPKSDIAKDEFIASYNGQFLCHTRKYLINKLKSDLYKAVDLALGI